MSLVCCSVRWECTPSHLSDFPFLLGFFFFFFFQTGHSFDDVECLGDGLPLFVFIPTKLGPELYIITFIAAGVCG